MSDRQQITVKPFEVQRAEAFAEAQAEAAKKELDKTVPGGRYVQPDGAVVDANGVPVKDEPKADAKKADR